MHPMKKNIICVIFTKTCAVKTNEIHGKNTMNPRVDDILVISISKRNLYRKSTVYENGSETGLHNFLKNIHKIINSLVQQY